MMQEQSKCQMVCEEYQPVPNPYPLPPSPAPTPAPTPPCVDNNQWCGDWAAIGECEANPAYMLVNCRYSCGVCSGCCAPRPGVDEPECVGKSTAMCEQMME